MNHQPKYNEEVELKSGVTGVVKNIEFDKESGKPYLYTVKTKDEHIKAFASDFKGE